MLLPLPLFPNRYVNTCIFLFKLSELVLCLCLDLAIGLSLAPPFLTRIEATGIWSSNFQTAAGLRPGDLFFVSFFPKQSGGGGWGAGICLVVWWAKGWGGGGGARPNYPGAGKLLGPAFFGIRSWWFWFAVLAAPALLPSFPATTR